MTKTIMVHGYAMEDVALIVRALRDALKQDIGFISATGRGSESVKDIMEAAPKELFKDEEHKMLMFIEFEDDAIYDSMMAFPEDMERPMFCMPTKDNVEWSLTNLLEHLVAEKGE